MRKLTLDLDSLDVQSFDPAPVPAVVRGTVRGHGSYNDCTGFQPYCPSMYDEAGTCHVSDLGTCNLTCGSTCAYTCDDPYSCVTCQGVQCEEPW